MKNYFECKEAYVNNKLYEFGFDAFTFKCNGDRFAWVYEETPELMAAVTLIKAAQNRGENMVAYECRDIKKYIELSKAGFMPFNVKYDNAGVCWLYEYHTDMAYYIEEV